MHYVIMVHVGGGWVECLSLGFRARIRWARCVIERVYPTTRSVAGAEQAGAGGCRQWRGSFQYSVRVLCVVCCFCVSVLRGGRHAPPLGTCLQRGCDSSACPPTSTSPSSRPWCVVHPLGADAAPPLPLPLARMSTHAHVRHWTWTSPACLFVDV